MLGMAMQPRAYWWPEGREIVVQNWIGAHQGQEHRHTEEDFERWRADAERDGWEVVEANQPS